MHQYLWHTSKHEQTAVPTVTLRRGGFQEKLEAASDCFVVALRSSQAIPEKEVTSRNFYHTSSALFIDVLFAPDWLVLYIASGFNLSSHSDNDSLRQQAAHFGSKHRQPRYSNPIGILFSFTPYFTCSIIVPLPHHILGHVSGPLLLVDCHRSPHLPSTRVPNVNRSSADCDSSCIEFHTR